MLISVKKKSPRNVHILVLFSFVFCVNPPNFVKASPKLYTVAHSNFMYSPRIGYPCLFALDGVKFRGDYRIQLWTRFGEKDDRMHHNQYIL